MTGIQIQPIEILLRKERYINKTAPLSVSIIKGLKLLSCGT